MVLLLRVRSPRELNQVDLLGRERRQRGGLRPGQGERLREFLLAAGGESRGDRFPIDENGRDPAIGRAVGGRAGGGGGGRARRGRDPRRTGQRDRSDGDES